ncbi:putative penicillin-binding protein [Dendrothele bispora CBS 962.96]|uniref:Putative penicillin-binding protein n=1 Tax=Dendrothele bispora (strain CBS 962.96) TaxID=1314807 RepID=A0A4S8LS25_DENBC|nr:putative penicillin-binding protein [Dendrothele bispora CBS 962.96]
MNSFRTELATATGESGREKQNVAATVIIAGNKSGENLQVLGPLIQEAHGFKTLAKNSTPIDLNTTFWVASCTKLMTTIAALQLVEQGLIDLDEDITRVLHEWKNPMVLTGFDDNGKPMTRPAKNKMTLRHLLTHSAGLGYDFLTPAIQKWKSVFTLLFEPGEGWEYSYSLEWVGVVVERLSGHGRLGDYMSKYIWGPLGMNSTTFRLNEREDVRSHLLEMLSRDERGHLKICTECWDAYIYDFDLGGGGVYTSATDYAKLLAALLRNDGTLLKKETVDLMFTPQLPDTKYMIEYMKANPTQYTLLSALPFDADWNWGLGGMLRMKDAVGKRKALSLHWGGLPNLSWWIDRSSEVFGLYATQIVPFGDIPSTDLFSRFEETVYTEMASNKI